MSSEAHIRSHRSTSGSTVITISRMLRVLLGSPLSLPKTISARSDDDVAPLDWPTIWSVLVNSEMSPRRVVIRGVCLQDLPKMCLTPDDHMVEAFTADRPDRTFDISI